MKIRSLTEALDRAIQQSALIGPLAVVIAFSLFCSPNQASAQDRTFLSGSCQSGSYVAEGPTDSDLGKRRSPYFCTDAIAVTFDTNGRTLVQFVEKKSSVGVILGFAGVFDASGRKLFVDRIYFNPAEAKSATDGVCIFKPLPIRGTTIECIAMVDEDDRRTIAAVYFGGE
jgi:hypothetical protein